jgi:hypothetical protein
MRRRPASRVAGLALVVVLAASVAWIGHAHFTRWETPPRGVKAFSLRSPRGTWEVVVYEIPYGGAAGGVAFRADIVHLPDGQARELYYDEPSSFQYEASVRWESDDVVVIAGRRLSAVDGRFDFRYDGSPWVRWGIVAGMTLVVSAVGFALVLLLTRPLRRGQP